MAGPTTRDDWAMTELRATAGGMSWRGTTWFSNAMRAGCQKPLHNPSNPWTNTTIHTCMMSRTLASAREAADNPARD